MGKGNQHRHGIGGGTEHRANVRKRQQLRLSLAGWSSAEAAALTSQLQALTLCLQSIASDGNCLFRALADQMWGEPGRHVEVREAAVKEMIARADHFRNFLLEEDILDLGVDDWDGYMRRMSEDAVWGGNSELLAAADFYARDIVVHQANEKPWVVTPNKMAAKQAGPLHLAYDGTHYDSVRRVGLLDGPAEHRRDIFAAAPAAAAPAQETASRAELNVMRAFPSGDVDIFKARRALSATLGDVDAAIESILEEQADGACDAAGGTAAGKGSAAASEPAAPSPSAALKDEKAARLARAALRASEASAAAKASADKNVAPKRNSPCPCGSKLAYKKCCLVTKYAAAGGSGGAPSAEDDNLANALTFVRI